MSFRVCMHLFSGANFVDIPRFASQMHSWVDIVRPKFVLVFINDHNVAVGAPRLLLFSRRMTYT